MATRPHPRNRRRFPFLLPLLLLLFLAAPRQAQTGEIRRLESQHLILFTDLVASTEVDEIPAAFDSAVPQWCEYFSIDAQRAAEWKMTAYVIENKQQFESAGLIPAELPPFLHGYQRGDKIWVYEQPSAYYRRHLVLHEGTHGFMLEFLGGCGPPWYMEGIAEYIGTHRWHAGRVQLAYMPRSNDEAPYWARVAIVRDAVAAGKHLSLIDVMRYDKQAHQQLEPYGWCWAAVTFFAQHPEYREAFDACQGDVHDTSLEFSRRFYQRLQPRWNEVEWNWQVFVADLDYGYDTPRAAIRFAAPRAIPAGGVEITIQADRGWQSTGLRLESGKQYQLKSSGRYQVGHEPKPWWCEPNGVTIHYHRGQPLGRLLGAVVPDDDPQVFRSPLSLGHAAELRPEHEGTLFLCINEAASGLADNRGQVTVRIEEQKP
jgi:hypothetical protein